MKKEIRKINISKPFIAVIIVIISIVVFLISVIVVGVTNNSRRREVYTSFSLSDLSPSASLVDHSLTINRNHEYLRFESLKGNSQIGTSDTYIFSTRGSSENIMKISYDLDIYKVTDVYFTVTLCDDDGNNERPMDISKVSTERKSIIYTSSSDIFIKKIDMRYIVII